MQHNMLTKNNYTLNLIHDQYPSNPREEFDQLGTMACFHSRYKLGDKHNLSLEEAQEIEQSADYIALPLYLYDHSGITISTKPFSCRFDSGKVGIIFVSTKKLADEGLATTPFESILNYLRLEVQEYDDYLTGNCWGYSITDNQGNTVDSCSGFYGKSHCYNEGLLSLEYYASRQLELPLGVQA